MMNIKRFYKKMNIIIKEINYEKYTHYIHQIKYTQLKFLMGGYNIHPIKYPLNTPN